ncbi:MAG: mechanosensitive ion channel family protein [Halolamina sp.]
MFSTGQPLNLPSHRLSGVIRELIGRIADFETRVLLTVLLVGAAGLIAFYVAPYAVRATDEFIQEVTTEASTFRSFVPPRLILRSVQVLTVFTASLVLLLVWGYVQLASELADLLIAAAPLAVKVGGTIALLVGLVLAADLVKRRIRGLSEETERMGEHEESVLIRVTNLLILVAVGLATLSLWNFDIANLLIGAGFLGIVFGMAARQVLAAAISGLVLMFSRPFEVGDWVQVGDTEGTVMDITIMHTHLRSFDGESIVLPNDKVEGSTVVNRTERGRLRLEVDVGVDYETDLDDAQEVALDAIESVDNVLDIPSPQVIGLEFGDSAVTVRMRFWIDNPSSRRKWRTRSAVIDSVKTAFEREDIEIPFPKRALAADESVAEVAAPAE